MSTYIIIYIVRKLSKVEFRHMETKLNPAVSS